MATLSIGVISNNGFDQKWGKGLLLSAFAHLVLISFVLFMPESITTRRNRDVVYEVDLVELPDLQRSTARMTPRMSAIPSPATPAKRVLSTQQDEKPVVMAKRVLKRKTQVEERPKISPTKILDQALVRTEPDTRSRETTALDQAIPRNESPSVNQGTTGSSSDQPESGITIRLYQMQVETIIKGNWIFPTSLRSPDSNKDLMAIVVLLVKNDGTVLKSRFKKRSSNALFDQSVLKAIERSVPLPPLPYKKTQDEIEINFNLSDLEGE